MDILEQKNQNQQQLINNNYSTTESYKQTLSNSSLIDEGEHPTITQLKALGYQVGDRVTVRCLPLDESKYAINLDGTLTSNNLDLWTLRPVGDKKWKRHKHKQDGLSYLHSVNDNGYGIYFNVNGGRSNAEVERVKASIFECDFGSLDEQRELINSLGIEPTITVWSGSRSIHAYFAIAPEDGKKFEQWTTTQETIALATASDPALKDYTRLLRLAGFKHQKSGNVASIEINNGCQYRLKDIEQSFNDRYPYSEKRYKVYQFLNGMLTDKNRDFGIDPKIVYQFAESNLDLELERYRQYKKAFTNGEHDEAQRLLKAPYSEIKKVKKERKQKERTLDANLSQVSNNTGFNSVYQYFASNYATGFHDGGNGFWKCKCPVHEGNSNDSLHLKKDGSFIKCHSGCDTQEIYSELRDRAIKAGDKLAKSEFGGNKPSELTNVAITINQKRIGDLQIPDNKNVVAFCSEKSTGKTHWMKTHSVPEALAENKPILGITHRIQLSRGMATDFQIPYVDRANKEQFCMVINSLHEFSQAEFTTYHLHKWDGAYLYFDEFNQMLWELHNGDLMKDKRALILSNLKALINHALKTGGKIFLADADLSDIDINFVKGCCETEEIFKPYIVKNTYQPHKELGTNLFLFTDSEPKSWLSTLLACCHKKKRVLAHLSAQKVNSTYGSKTLESTINKSYPYLKVLRIDSETIADPSHPAHNFIARYYADPSIINYYDVILTTPVIETGISIDDLKGHFDAVFGCFWGQQSPNTVSQTLFRHRGSIPRYVWLNPYPNTQVGCGSTNPLELIQDTANKAEKLISNLTKAGYINQDDIDLVSSSGNLFLRTWAKMGARLNEQYNHYFKACVARLKRDGYKVITTDGSDLVSDNSEVKESLEIESTLGEKIVGEMVKTRRDANKEKYYKKIASLPMPDQETLNKLKNKNDPTPEEKDTKYRGYVENFYSVSPTKTIIQADIEEALGQKLQLYYYLTTGADFLPQKDSKAVDNLLKAQNIKGFSQNKAVLATDINSSTLTDKVQALKRLGVYQFLNAPKDKVWTQETLRGWFNYWLAHKDLFKQLTGLTITEKTKPIQLANEVLDSIDCKLEQHKRLSGDGRKWSYKFKTRKYISQNQKCEILKSWHDKDSSQNLSSAPPKHTINTIRGSLTKNGQNPDTASDTADFTFDKPRKNTFPQDAIAQAKKETNPYNQIRSLITHPLVHTFTTEGISEALGLAKDYVWRSVEAMEDLIKSEDGLLSLDF